MSSKIDFSKVGKVAGFEAKNNSHREQVRIHHYQNAQNFIVSLITKNKKTDEEFFLIKTSDDHSMVFIARATLSMNRILQ